MKAERFAAAVFAFLFALGSVYPAYGAQDAAIVTYLEGDVKARADKDSAWKAAALEMGLGKGWQLKTGADSKAKFALEDDSLVVVGELSVFEITDVAIDSAAGTNNSSFYLTSGQVRAEVAKLTGKGSAFEVHTPAAIAGVRGTDFMVEAAEGTEDTTVTVFDGEVELGNRRGKVKRFVKVMMEHAADVRGENEPGEPRRVDKEKLRKLKEKMAHRMQDKLKGKFAEVDDRKAAALIALRRQGVEGEMVSGLLSGMKAGRVSPGMVKDVLSLAARGAGKGEVREALALIKDRQVGAEDFEGFMKAARERGGGEGVREALKNFREKMDKAGGRGAGAGRTKGGTGGKMEEPGEQIDKTDPNDPKRREVALLRYALQKGVPREKIEGLLKAYREGRLDHAEIKMLIGAVAKGADPQYLRDVLTRLDKMKVDRKVRMLLLTALEVGVSKEQLKAIITRLENKEITIEQLREYIKKQLQQNPPPKPGAEKKAAPPGKKK